MRGIKTALIISFGPLGFSDHHICHIQGALLLEQDRTPCIQKRSKIRYYSRCSNRTVSSVGRAFPSHGRGHGFESCTVHRDSRGLPNAVQVKYPCETVWARRPERDGARRGREFRQQAKTCDRSPVPSTGTQICSYLQKSKPVSGCGIVVLCTLRVRKTRVRFSAPRHRFGLPGPIVKW